jgi:uncharacterized membrane protein YhaH (DUF805 family)/Tfp pilus assembly major pilin PilA
MQNRNPYAAPQTNVARGDSVEEYGEIKVLSASGRLGRVRYIGYSMALSLLLFLVFAIAAGVTAAASPTLAIVVVVVGYIALYTVQILLSIQRAHDMNSTGWLSLIIFVPLAVFVFWFAPGTTGENSYGKQPPPNTTGAILLACLPVPFVFMMAILAAIAIPAYQDYTIRAQVSEGLSLAAGPKAAVAEAYLSSRVAPVDRSEAGLPPEATDTSGKYVESVDVAGGTILVTYGSEANSVIAGRVLGIQPYVTSDRTVVWRCGAGPAPQGAVPMDAGAPSAAGATDVEARHLPSACRPGFAP